MRSSSLPASLAAVTIFEKMALSPLGSIQRMLRPALMSCSIMASARRVFPLRVAPMVNMCPSRSESGTVIVEGFASGSPSSAVPFPMAVPAGGETSPGFFARSPIKRVFSRDFLFLVLTFFSFFCPFFDV